MGHHISLQLATSSPSNGQSHLLPMSHHISYKWATITPRNEPPNTYWTNFFERIARSLIYHEQPERIAHGCSFVLSDLSDSLKVAHFLWATWAICSRSLIWFVLNERWANERIPSPASNVPYSNLFFNLQKKEKTQFPKAYVRENTTGNKSPTTLHLQ